MATPTALPATFVASTVLPASDLNLLRGAFRVLQVVYATSTVVTTVSTTAYIDSGISASITPQYSSSKVLAIVNHSVYSTAALTGGNIKLLRGATQLQFFLDMNYDTTSSQLGSFTTFCLDSPATTSATTYKTQIAVGSGAGQFLTQVNSNPGNIILMEISA